jgi:BolA protein
MSTRIERIREALERALSPQQLEIVDDSAAHVGHAGAAGGGHFRVRLVAEAFRGRTVLQRHRMVYEAVSELMGTDIHALNIVARTPDEAK